MTERHLLGGWEAKKKKRVIHSWCISPASHQATAMSPSSSFLSVLSSCCQLPKDICSHPLLNEKVLMHDFRICQNIQYLLVFGDAANLTTGKRNEYRVIFLKREGKSSQGPFFFFDRTLMFGRGPSLASRCLSLPAQHI